VVGGGVVDAAGVVGGSVVRDGVVGGGVVRRGVVGGGVVVGGGAAGDGTTSSWASLFLSVVWAGTGEECGVTTGAAA
jgi:hypothetical protein